MVYVLFSGTSGSHIYGPTKYAIDIIVFIIMIVYFEWLQWQY